MENSFMQTLIVFILFFLSIAAPEMECAEESPPEEIDQKNKVFHYYCTVADARHFPQLINLIGSIHKHDFNALDEIAVFDIGLNQDQRNIIDNIEKTKLYAVEKTHKDIDKYFQTSPQGRTVRGWYAWKPVVFKQALDQFPYFIYLDAGSLVLSSPDNLFRHVQQQGYFIITLGNHPIEERITQAVIDQIVLKLPKEQAEFVLNKDTSMIDAGFQGLSRDVLAAYVMPMYQNSKNLDLFADDGSSKKGFGEGRHDQTLFSIYANLNKMNMNPQGWSQLHFDGKSQPFHMHWDRNELNDFTSIYRSRGDYQYGGDKISYIHWKKPIEGQKKLY